VLREACYIVGGGPSLTHYDFNLLETRHVIAINNAMFKLSNKIGYFSDRDWFYKHEERIKARPGRLIRGGLPGEELNLPFCEEWTFTKERGLVLEPRSLAHGNNSGCAAINLAVQLGYKDIRLLGFDCAVVNGQTNFHSEHDRTTPHSAYAQVFVPAFEALVAPLEALAVTVVNLTPNSALKVFPLQI
jgi:hypothetical protein